MHTTCFINFLCWKVKQKKYFLPLNFLKKLQIFSLSYKICQEMEFKQRYRGLHSYYGKNKDNIQMIFESESIIIGKK